MTTSVLPSQLRTGERKASVFALARFEGRVILRHRLIWFGALLSVAWAVWEIRQEAPVLNRVSMTLAWTMLPLAAAVMLVAGGAVLRARGRSDADPPVVTPMGMDRRVAGIVLGLAGPALLAFAVQLFLMIWVFTRDPVASLVWSEVLAGPLLVVFAGALSAALSRWIPHPATPLFAIFVLAGTILIPYDQSNWGRQLGAEWLSPLAWPQGIIPYEVTLRPSGLHLAYLVLLVLSVGAVASIGRSPKAWFLAASSLGIAAAVGLSQLGPIAESERASAIGRLVGDNADLNCETHFEVDFCAMPGYAGWIDDWVEIVVPVVRAAPSEAARGLQVRQYPIHNTSLVDVSSDWWWYGEALRDLGRRDVVPVASANYPRHYFQPLPLLVAQRLIGCTPLQCEGQAQMVTFLWLAAHSPGVQKNTVDDPSWGTEFGSVADCMVRDLWSSPNAASLIHEHWTTLSDPRTSYNEAAVLLGVSVPQGYDNNGNFTEGCP